MQHGDELVLLSVHMLRDASVMNPAISYQCHVDAALILQFGRYLKIMSRTFDCCI